MSRRTVVLLAIVLAACPLVHAKNNKKQVLPNYVLKAQTVFVIVHPDAGEPVNNPTANRTAQDNVEKALAGWGRFRLVMDAQTADLIIAIRKGYAAGPMIGSSPIDHGPVIVQPSGGDIRIGSPQARPPDLTNSPGGSAGRRPGMGNEVGTTDDTFEVYRGGTEYPLDTSPIWRYVAKDALNTPKVTAVEEFRKIISETEKQQQQKP